MGASFVIGNEPSKSWDLSTDLRQRWVTDRLWESTNVLRQYYSSTLNVAYDQIIASIVDSAQTHIKLADELNSQVVEVLKGVERKNEEAKKKVSRLANNFYFIQFEYLLLVLGTTVLPKVACKPWSLLHWPCQGWDCHSLIPRPI